MYSLKAIRPWHTPFLTWDQSVVPCLVLTVASGPAYRLLRRQIRWSGIAISLRIFQFVLIHTVKGFGLINKAEVDVFLELSISVIQWMLKIWSLVPLPFLNPTWISGSSRFMYYWSLTWRILSITLLGCEMSAIVLQFWAFFDITFLWDWNENWPFPVLWPLLSFPNLLAYWVQLFCSIIFSDFQ